MEDVTLLARLHRGMRHFYRALAASAPGGRVVEADGVLASVTPSAPGRSYPNAVLVDDVECLAAAYDELARAYDDAGVRAWTVWVPEHDAAMAGLLARQGHVLDAAPEMMARELAGVSRPAPGSLEDWTASGDPALVGALNDRAYGYEDGSFETIMANFGGAGEHVYVGSSGGVPVTCLIVSDRDGNCEIDAVATPPEARGSNFSGQLLAHALVDAAERGCQTTTLVATALGRPIYDRLGYRGFGQLRMWERRVG